MTIDGSPNTVVITLEKKVRNETLRDELRAKHHLLTYRAHYKMRKMEVPKKSHALNIERPLIVRLDWFTREPCIWFLEDSPDRFPLLKGYDRTINETLARPKYNFRLCHCKEQSGVS